LGTQLYGKTLLIIGLGRIGSSVATRAKGPGDGDIFATTSRYINPKKSRKLGESNASMTCAGLYRLADFLSPFTYP